MIKYLPSIRIRQLVCFTIIRPNIFRTIRSIFARGLDAQQEAEIAELALRAVGWVVVVGDVLMLCRISDSGFLSFGSE